MSTQPEDFACLSPRRDGQCLITINGWHCDRSTQCCLCYVDRNVHQYIVFPSPEEFVGFNLDYHLQISCRTAVFTRFAQADLSDAHPIVHTTRHIDRHLSCSSHLTLSA